MKGAEINYIVQEKLALALVITACKLRPYFLSHPITVLNNNSIGRIVFHPDALGRLIKWVTKLTEYDITFEPRTAIQNSGIDRLLRKTIKIEEEEKWKIYVDGSSCQT